MCIAHTMTRYRHIHRDEDCITWFAQQLQDLAHRVKNIVSANVPITPRKHCRNSNGRYTVTRRGVTFARNHSRRTRRGSVIISLGDTVIQRIRIAILIIKIHYIFRSFFTIYLQRTLYN